MAGGLEEVEQQRTKDPSLFHRYKVTTGRLSVKTKVSYTYHINEFLAYYKVTDLAPLKEYSPKVIKQMVKDYVLYLRDFRKLSRKSIALHVSAIAHFFYIERDDEYTMDWKKVRDEIPPDENIRQDRAYTLEEIQKILSACSRKRDKVIIQLLESTGMRIGAIHTIRMGDLSPKQTEHGKIYKIEVYARSSAQYSAYCNVETAQIIDSYLNERTDAGEVLENDSSLIRNIWNSLTVHRAKKLSDSMVKHIVTRIVKASGIHKTFQFTGEAKRGKGFRKFYKTQAEMAGMKPINVELTHGHSIGISKHYYTPQESQVLEDYMTHAADALTIDQSKKLEKENQDLKTEKTQRIARLEARLNETEESLNEYRKIADDYTDLFVKSGKGWRKLVSNLRTRLKKEGKWTHSLEIEFWGVPD